MRNAPVLPSLPVVLLSLLAAAAAAAPPSGAPTNLTSDLAKLSTDERAVSTAVAQAKADPQMMSLPDALRRLRTEVAAGLNVTVDKLESFDARINGIVANAADATTAIADVKAEVDKLASAKDADASALVQKALDELRPSLLAALSERADQQLAAVRTDIAALKQRAAAGEADAATLRVQLAAIVARLRDASVLGTLSPPAIDADAYRARITILHKKDRINRKNRHGDGEAVVYWYPEGVQTPLGGRAVSIFWCQEPNGPRTKVGDFATDPNGRLFYDFPVLSRDEAPKIYIYYQFAGDAAFRPTTLGPLKIAG